MTSTEKAVKVVKEAMKDCRKDFGAQTKYTLTVIETIEEARELFLTLP